MQDDSKSRVSFSVGDKCQVAVALGFATSSGCHILMVDAIAVYEVAI